MAALLLGDITLNFMTVVLGFFRIRVPSTFGFIVTVTRDFTRGCFSALTNILRYFLSSACLQSCRHQQSSVGASIVKSPSCGALYISKTARFIILSGPILRMWPSHTSLLRLTSSQRLYVHVAVLASSTLVFPVNRCRQAALTPFNLLRHLLLSSHASLP